jgi:phosphoribosylformylglycinamidine synthase subunit PurS
VTRVVVDVMLKPEILDPQGRAVMGALGRLGLTGIASVRQGKRFEIEVEGEVDEDLSERLHELAGSLLSNPVIEDYEIYEEGEEIGCDCDDCVCEPSAEESGADGASEPVAAEAAAAAPGGCACGGQGCGGGSGPVDVEAPVAVEKP